MRPLTPILLILTLCVTVLLGPGCEQRISRATAKLALAESLNEDQINAEMSVLRDTPFLKHVFDQLSASQLQRLDKTASDQMTEPATKKIFQGFYRRVGVGRVEESRVLTVSFTHPDAGLAAEIANRICDTYLGINGKQGRVLTRAAAPVKPIN